jgi:hypothetical protein
MNKTYDETNRFILFRNENKAEDRDPDFTGNINVDGVDHFFDAWCYVENGKLKRINGRIGKKKNRQPNSTVAVTATNSDPDDRIPF